MKNLIIIMLFVSAIAEAQWSGNILPADMSGDDSVYIGTDSRPRDVSSYHFRILITEKSCLDTVTFTFGGRMKGGLFESFIHDSLPYTMNPTKNMTIENGDTVCQKMFDSDGLYKYKTPEIKVWKLNADDTLTYLMEFYKQ